MRLLALVVLASSSMGCSYILVSGLPEHSERMRYFDCTSSVAAPVIDSALALSSTASLPYNNRIADGAVRRQALTSNVLGFLLYASSAVYGYYTTSECRAAKGALTARVNGDDDGERQGGCTKDTECKGERVCVGGMCVAPPPSRAPPPSPPVQPGGPPPLPAPR